MREIEFKNIEGIKNVKVSEDLINRHKYPINHFAKAMFGLSALGYGTAIACSFGVIKVPPFEPNDMAIIFSGPLAAGYLSILLYTTHVMETGKYPFSPETLQNLLNENQENKEVNRILLMDGRHEPITNIYFTDQNNQLQILKEMSRPEQVEHGPQFATEQLFLLDDSIEVQDEIEKSENPYVKKIGQKYL